MTVAKVAACLPDITLQDLGILDLKGAQDAFDTFPWATHLRQSEVLDAAGQTCVTPDLTFRIGDCHVTTRINEDGQTFSLEVCVPRARRILGIFGKLKFYEVARVSRAQCKAAIDVFFTKTAEVQHDYFQHLRASAA